ncbi:unnamed protein product [Calypogeia fissa]
MVHVTSLQVSNFVKSPSVPVPALPVVGKRDDDTGGQIPQRSSFLPSRNVPSPVEAVVKEVQSQSRQPHPGTSSPAVRRYTTDTVLYTVIFRLQTYCILNTNTMYSTAAHPGLLAGSLACTRLENWTSPCRHGLET